MVELVLYFRPQEQKAFDGLPADLQDGWKVEAEGILKDERPEALKMRRLMFKTDNSELTKALQCSDVQQIFHAAKNLSPVKMLEVCFALGSKAISTFIVGLLQEANTNEDLQGIAELSALRHVLLKSNAKFPSLQA